MDEHAKIADEVRLEVGDDQIVDTSFPRHLPDIVHFHLPKLALPSINGLLGDAMLPGRRFNGCRLRSSQNPNNLLFRETRLLHVSPPQVEENLTYPWSKIRGALQALCRNQALQVGNHREKIKKIEEIEHLF